MSQNTSENNLEKKEKSTLSYPSQGNDLCFQIEDNSFWFCYRNDLILQTLKLSDKLKSLSQQRILDLGGGNGFVAKMLQDQGLNVLLAEPGDGAKNAKKRGLKNIFHGPLESLPSQKFDVIGLFDVIEHIAAPLPFLQLAQKFLQKEGQIILTVPCYNILWSKEDEAAGHFRRYTLKSLRRELNDANFEIVYHTYFFAALLIPIFLFRSIPYFFCRKNTKEENKLEDLVAQSTTDSIVRFILNLERRYISKVSRLPFGASLIVVAKKAK